MATPSGATRPSKDVAATSLDLLLMELVEHVTRNSSSKEATFYKLEKIGFHVGQRLVARYTKDRPRFQGDLEIIKFICKEFWEKAFKKQIDNLRTNHKDNKFRMLTNISGTTAMQEASAPYVMFPCGLIRGALAALGVSCIVTGEIPALPCCT